MDCGNGHQNHEDQQRYVLPLQYADLLCRLQPDASRADDAARDDAEPRLTVWTLPALWPSMIAAAALAMRELTYRLCSLDGWVTNGVQRSALRRGGNCESQRRIAG